MAIRLEHKVGAIGGLSAFATGVGKAQERKKKYRTDLMQTQQAREDKYGLTMQQHEWDVEKEGRDKAAADARLATVELGRDRRLDASLASSADISGLSLKNRTSVEARNSAGALVNSIFVPPGLNQEQKREVEKLRNVAMAFTGPDIDLNDTDHQKKFNTAINNLKSYIENADLPSLAERKERSVLVNKDLSQDQWDPNKEMFVPYRDAPTPATPWGEQYSENEEARARFTKAHLNELGLEDVEEMDEKQRKEYEFLVDKEYPRSKRPAAGQAADDPAAGDPAAGVGVAPARGRNTFYGQPTTYDAKKKYKLGDVVEFEDKQWVAMEDDKGRRWQPIAPNEASKGAATSVTDSPTTPPMDPRMSRAAPEGYYDSSTGFESPGFDVQPSVPDVPESSRAEQVAGGDMGDVDMKHQPVEGDTSMPDWRKEERRRQEIISGELTYEEAAMQRLAEAGYTEKQYIDAVRSYSKLKMEYADVENPDDLPTKARREYRRAERILKTVKGE